MRFDWLKDLPPWLAMVALVVFVLLFGYTALWADQPFKFAGLEFGRIKEAPTVQELAKEVVSTFDVPTVEFPKGTVLLVADEAGCPAVGWDEYDKARGKFIIGVGHGVLTPKGDHGHPASPAKLQPVAFEDQGGGESFTLKLEQMPAHRHRLSGNIPRPTENVRDFLLQ